MTNLNDAYEVARLVCAAIAILPPLEGTRLMVDEKGIVATEVGGKTWWRVPIIPILWPKRMSFLYEVLAEIEEHLQEEDGLDILLFAGDPCLALPS